MQKRQVIALMQRAQIVGTVSGKGEEWSVELNDDADKDAFCTCVADVGGYRTGWGGWVLRPNYKSRNIND